jgi:two-component system sensor histidine kinase HupT/HoxJ
VTTDQTYAELLRHQAGLEAENRALAEAQRSIASVLAAMTDVLIVCDGEGLIEQVNPALEALTGEGAEALAGRPFLSLLTPESRTRARDFARKVRTQAIRDCELSLIGRAPEPVPLAVNCSARFDRRGHLLGMVLIGRPVGELRRAYEDLNRTHAELKAAQQRLISAEKMASLGRLVAGVAHELNNPISYVYGNIHALARYRERLGRFIRGAEAAGLSAAQRRLWEDLRIAEVLADLEPLLQGTLEGAERLRDLVADLRRFSAGARGERAAFDLSQVVRTAAHWVARGGGALEAGMATGTGAGEYHPALTLDLPPELPMHGHAGQVQQAVMNLIQNALDAVQGLADPRVQVRLSAAADRAVLTVQDNGPGVPECDRLRVFDPFFTTKPVGQGTGLGLSISYGIVSDHGGTLALECPPEGGARLRVELPLRA